MRHVLLIFLLIISTNTHAISSVERENLIRIVQELELLKDDINAIENKILSPNAKQKFNYKSLLSDLDMICSGIKQATNSNSREPKVLTPLTGKY